MEKDTLLLRIVIAIILLSHGIPGMLDGGVNDFGNLFLNKIGFSPIGVPLAWLVKISHVVCAGLLLANKFVKPAAGLTIFILIIGIVTVHFKEGWFVVGGGRNGMEYNFLLICILIYIIIRDKNGSFNMNR